MPKETPHTVGHSIIEQSPAEGLVSEELESDRTRNPVLSSATFPMVPPPSFSEMLSFTIINPLKGLGYS